MTTDERTRIERVLGRAFACAPDCGGMHHLPKIKWDEFGAEINVRDSLATFDGSELTRLVIGAHDECIRLEVSQAGPRQVKLRLWPRQGRDGRLFDRHPTIEQAIETYRRRGRRLEEVPEKTA